MPKFMIDTGYSESLGERTPPEGGWHEPTCTFDSHNWTLEVEDGRVNIRCMDPCDPDLFSMVDRIPTCLCDWQQEDYVTAEPIPIKLHYVDDSTPSTVDGPAEWGYWIEISLPEAET